MKLINKLFASLIVLAPSISACVYGPNPVDDYCEGDDAYCKNTFGEDWVCGAANYCVIKNADSQSDDDAGSDANSDAQSDN